MGTEVSTFLWGGKFQSGGASKHKEPEVKNSKFLKVCTRFFPVTLLCGLSDLFQGLSDLHLGDQKVTWKKLVVGQFHPLEIVPSSSRKPYVFGTRG